MTDRSDRDGFEPLETTQELLELFAAGLAEVIDALGNAIGAAQDVFLGSGDEGGVLTWLGRLDALLEELGDHDNGPDGS